jgi:hypothetical protein
MSACQTAMTKTEMTAGPSSAITRAAAASDCTSATTFHPFDFWLGSWDVYVAGNPVGTNKIGAILRGCAFVERWSDTDGHKGESFFYYLPAQKTWKQVWVTDTPFARGGVKEKTMLTNMGTTPVIFQGSYPVSAQENYLDRTILSHVDENTARQVIEISRDGGVTWKAVFDAVYLRKRHP